MDCLPRRCEQAVLIWISPLLSYSRHNHLPTPNYLNLLPFPSLLDTHLYSAYVFLGFIKISLFQGRHSLLSFRLRTSGFFPFAVLIFP